MKVKMNMTDQWRILDMGLFEMMKQKVVVWSQVAKMQKVKTENVIAV